MSRLSGRIAAKITIEVQGGRTIAFNVRDWALDVEQYRVDVTQTGCDLAWVHGPTRGTLDFAISPEPVQTTGELVDARLALLDRYLRMIRAVE